MKTFRLWMLAATLLQPSDMTEAMLPEAGYYYDAADRFACWS